MDADPAGLSSDKSRAARVVAIVMDGNGRWAESRGVSVAEGHRAGARTLRRVVEASIELGIETLVVYAFSTENWSRPTDEVADLMELLSDTIDEELPDLAKQGVRTRFLGRRDRIEPWLEHKMRSLEEQTAHLDTLQLWIAFDYGGRAEIAHAAKRLVEDGLEPAQVDEDALAARSNFLLWEAAYAELVFTDTLWPDFDASDLRAAVDTYAARRRRFGARSAS